MASVLRGRRPLTWRPSESVTVATLLQHGRPDRPGRPAEVARRPAGHLDGERRIRSSRSPRLGRSVNPTSVARRRRLCQPAPLRCCALVARPLPLSCASSVRQSTRVHAVRRVSLLDDRLGAPSLRLDTGARPGGSHRIGCNRPTSRCACTRSRPPSNRPKVPAGACRSARIRSRFLCP